MASAMGGSATASQKRRAVEAFTTLPVLPNCWPYNEMLFNKQLKIGKHHDGVKTRSWAPKHRGPMLLYTSTSAHRTPCLAWGYDPKNFQSGVIVGVGDLVDVRKLTHVEDIGMLMAFNNLMRFKKMVEADKWMEQNHCGYIHAFPNGLFFKNLKRFKKPIAFKPPKGAVSMFRAPLSLVAKALKEAGYKV